MIDEVFRKNKTTQKIADAEERFLKISPMPDGSKVVDTRSSRLTYVADPVDDKDAINKSWATKYFKDEKDAVTKLGEVANQDLAKAKADLDEAKHLANEVTTEVKGIVVDFKDKQGELEALKKNLENLKESLESSENGNVINDTIISTRSTYSSQKVETLLNEKANADDLLGIFSNGKIKAEILPDIDATTLDGKGTDYFEAKSESTTKYSTLSQSVERVKGSLNQGLNSLSNSLGTKISSALKGVANGVATLDNSGKIPSSQLPEIDTYTKEQSNDKFAPITSLPSLATETKAGITKLKNSITAKQEDAAVTEKAVSDFVQSHTPPSLGVAQSWSDVTSSRDTNITYTNTTDKPIMVLISGEPNMEGDLFIFVNGVKIFTQELDSMAETSISFIVPPKQTYRAEAYYGNGGSSPRKLENIFNSRYKLWAELR